MLWCPSPVGPDLQGRRGGGCGWRCTEGGVFEEEKSGLGWDALGAKTVFKDRALFIGPGELMIGESSQAGGEM